MELRETDPAILLKIEGTEDIASVLRPDDVLALIRACKLIHGEREKMRKALISAQKHIRNGYQPDELMEQIEEALTS